MVGCDTLWFGSFQSKRCKMKKNNVLVIAAATGMLVHAEWYGLAVFGGIISLAIIGEYLIGVLKKK